MIQGQVVGAHRFVLIVYNIYLYRLYFIFSDIYANVPFAHSARISEFPRKRLSNTTPVQNIYIYLSLLSKYKANLATLVLQYIDQHIIIKFILHLRKFVILKPKYILRLASKNSCINVPVLHQCLHLPL